MYLASNATAIQTKKSIDFQPGYLGRTILDIRFRNLLDTKTKKAAAEVSGGYLHNSSRWDRKRPTKDPQNLQQCNGRLRVSL